MIFADVIWILKEQKLISQIEGLIAARSSFDYAMNANLTKIKTNLIPYPRIQFPLSTYSYDVVIADNLSNESIGENVFYLFYFRKLKF
jgi:hypothetical protein